MKQFVIDQEQWVHSKDGMEVLLPSSIGQGRMKVMDLSPGLQLLVSDYTLNETTCMEYPYSPSGWGFGFCLSGSLMSHPAVFVQEFPICGGQSAFVHIPMKDKAKETVKKNRVRKINIMLSSERLYKATLLKEFPRYFKTFASRPCRVPSTITPAMGQALLDILECPYQGIARHFFLEGKAMELVAYKLEQMFYENGISLEWADSVVTDEDIDRMKQVAKAITNRMSHPFNLSELANIAGICRSKLHKCFKQVYGVTPFDYARARRLEEAKQLLRKGENVTYVAFQLGYSSPSHFTKAFKQHFGYLPLQCRKN